MPNISFWMCKKPKVVSSPKELQWSNSLIYHLLPETRQVPMKQAHLIGLVILVRSNPFFKKPVFLHWMSKWKSNNVYIDLLLLVEILRYMYGLKNTVAWKKWRCAAWTESTVAKMRRVAIIINTQYMRKSAKSGGHVSSMLNTPKVLQRCNHYFRGGW